MFSNVRHLPTSNSRHQIDPYADFLWQTTLTKVNNDWSQEESTLQESRLTITLSLFSLYELLWYLSLFRFFFGPMDSDPPRTSSTLFHSRFFLFGFYCWDWEFLTALLLFSSSS
ncbi:hypothetical protein RJT34_30714 [Clitoria ternatea]|uniref:Uncharacterized protein n=1 Tax=Clitoria ternatea TaxID=43366 RepID=A0AAN9ESY3_CLITE